jgi:tetratricopeptide (TPR) repeat protein
MLNILITLLTFVSINPVRNSENICVNLPYNTLIIPAAISNVVNDSVINKAVELFETRHLNPTYLSTSANMLEDALKTDSNNLRINYMLSWVYYTIADHAELKKEKLDNYYKGLAYGKKAMRLDANSAWAHFWYLACLGQISQIKGIFNSLISVGEVKKEIEIVLKLDSSNVMAYNAKAMIYYELPGILGGDANKSIKFLKKALEVDSNYSMAYVTLGKCYIRKKNYHEARIYLNKVLSLSNGWPVADFVMDDKPEAIKLLKDIEGKK